MTLNTYLFQLREDHINGLGRRLANSLAQRRATFKAFANDSDQKQMPRAGAQHLGGHQAFGERRRVGIEPLCRHELKNVLFAIKLNTSRREVVGSDAIHKNDRIASRDALGQIECRSTEIGNLDAIAEAIGRLQKANDVGSDRVVAQKDIADAANEYVLHRIFATAIFRPDGSKA